MNLADLRMMSFQDAPRHLMGVVAGVLLVGAVALTLAVGSFGLLDDTYTMSGVFRDVTGLKVGHTVRVAGVEVGEVQRIEPDFELGQVVVTWSVDSSVDLGPETTATMAVNTLLGGYHVRLDGPVTEPHLAALPLAERRVPLERTAESFRVIEALDATTRGARDLDVDLVNQALRQVADLSEDNADTIASLIGRLDEVSATVASREEELTQLLADSNQVTDALAAKDAELVRLLQAAQTLLDELVARRDLLAAALGDGADAVVALSDLVDDSRDELDALLADVHEILEVTDRQQGAIHEQLTLLGPTFTNVGRTGQQGPWIDFLLVSMEGVST